MMLSFGLTRKRVPSAYSSNPQPLSIERPPVIFPTLFWKFSLAKLIFLNFSSLRSFIMFVKYTWIVLKQVLATPGCLSSVYRVLTVLIPCLTSSIPWGPEGFGCSWTTAPGYDSYFLPNLSSLSLFSYSSILAFASKNSFFSLFCYSSAISFYYSSSLRLFSDISFANLILFLSCSSAKRLSSSALFFLIASCNSFAFLSFSSLERVLVFCCSVSCFLLKWLIT